MTTTSDAVSGTSLENTMQHTENASMCTKCRNLLVCPEHPVRQTIEMVYDLGTIKESAVGGCSVCKIFHDSILNQRVLKKSECRVSITFMDQEQRCAIWIGLDLDIQVKLLPMIPGSSPTHAMDPYSFRRGPGSQIAVQTPLPSSNTRNQSSMDVATSWMQNCITNHKSCNSGSNEELSILPARLLKVTGTIMRLICTSEIRAKRHVSYMTLSHRWTDQNMPKLLTANLGALSEDLRSLTLPAVFRDAIVMARSLDIHFLWIDSLCIVQDDIVDVQGEIAKMGHIYKNAILNVGPLYLPSVSAGDGTSGLFLDRDLEGTPLFTLTIRRADHEGVYFACSWAYANELDASPLMERGWVFQERLLSRRSMYFGKQIWWECGEQRACEMFPEFLTEDASASERLTTLLNYGFFDHSGTKNQIGKAREIDEIYRRWEQLSGSFARCSLTFEQDKLPALSGIAHVFRDSLRTEYHAGLFLHVTPLGLLWYRDNDSYHDEGIRPLNYRAPSWSWASLNLRIGSALSDGLHKEVIAEIIDVQTLPQGHDPCGKLMGGHLTISSHLRKSARTLSKRYTRQYGDWSSHDMRFQYEMFDEGYDVDGTRPMQDCSFFVVAWSEETASGPVDAFTLTNEAAGGDQEIVDGSYSVGLSHVHGLILEVIDPRSSTYRRIGAFRHMLGKGRTVTENPKPEDYPEFLDFDPGSFERHKITII